jgi:CRP/FNR family cyclic AMP-dependent transcriptional regulator
MLRGESIVPARPTVQPFPSPSAGKWETFHEEESRRRRTRADNLATGLPTAIDWGAVLNGISTGRTNPGFGPNRVIFTQGEAAHSVYLVLQGQVKLTVVSHDGKGAIVATLGPGDFFGEGCLIGQTVRMATATSVTACRVTCVERSAMAHLVRTSPGLAEAFIAHLLSRIVRYEADLVDQMFNSSEKRLARVLLRLSHGEQDGTPKAVVSGVSQEHLAQMVGSTRSRINHFMTKFRRLGFIAYRNGGAVTVHRSLQRVIAAE